MAKEAVARREAGGYSWRDSVRKLIRSEEEERRVIEELSNREYDSDKLRVYLALTSRKIDKVTILNELLQYKGN